MNGLRRKVIKPLVLMALILVVASLQFSPVAADYSQCSRVWWKVITGTEEPTIPNIDADDGFYYIVSGAQTGTIPRWLMTNPSDKNIYSGTLLGTDSLSNMTYSDNVYWSVRSALGSGRYNPNSYVPLNSTQWKAGSLANVASDDSQYMSFESYPVSGQYGIRFNGTYMINAGNRRFLNLTGPFTIEMRIRLDRTYPYSSWSSQMALVSKHYGGDLGYWMWSYLRSYNSTASEMNVGNRLLNYSDPQNIDFNFVSKVGVWYHLAWVYDGSNNALYLDGIRKTVESPAIPSPGSPASFLIGGFDTDLLSYCSLDEVAVWNTSKWTGSSFTVPATPYSGNEANLCGLWHLDEGDGMVARDSSRNHYDGTATKTPLWVAGYKFASNPPYPGQYALEFDNTYLINVGNKAALNLTAPFTIEFRIKWNKAPVGTSAPQYNRFVVAKTTGGYGYCVWLEPTGGGWVTINAQLNGNSEGGSSPYKYTEVDYNFRPCVGAWQHFAWVHNGTQMRLYINGTNVRSLSTSYLPKSVTYPFLIGGEDYLSGPYAANISLDEVAVWSYAKYTANFASPTRPYVGNEANLRGLWHLDEGSGATAHDSSLYHNDGSATSTPIWAAGYHRVQLVNLLFSGASNIDSWQSLMWKTDLSCTLGSINATIQFFNWTAGRYQASGSGCLSYITNVNPDTDETKTQTVSLNHQQLRDPSTGNWKMNIRLWTVEVSSFQSKFDLIEYDPLSSGMDVELLSVLPDSSIKTGVSTFNVTVEVKCNASTVTHNLYVFNYSKGVYEFRQGLEVGQGDTIFHVNITLKASNFISQTGGMKIKVNSTYAGTFDTSFDLVQWDLKYYEPSYENYWRVDYRATIPKTEITKLSVKLKSGLNRTTGVAFLSMYNYTISSWTPIVQNVNHSSMLTQWYNTTTPSSIQGFIRSDGCLNVTFYAYDTNWTTFKVST
nr:LamG-like jellyroll fold domain-containing protein [Candidatus Njordarchaeum guaymaensis]